MPKPGSVRATRLAAAGVVGRREFLQALAAVSAATGCTKSSSPIANPAADPDPPAPPGARHEPPRANQIKLPAGGKVARRPLGRTGVEVSMLGLGGYHIGVPKDEQEAIRIVRMAIDHGVTFLDNCWDYHQGRSEERMGKALRDGYRARAFLMTKLDGRTKQAATEQLEQSLRRLQTDVIDLVQVHEVIRFSDPDRVFAEGGAIEGLVAAKQAGKVRFIGFTGHKNPAIHRKMLETSLRRGFTFDTVQMPVNLMDPHYQSFEAEVLPVLLRERIGVLGMKPMGSGVILDSGQASPQDCLRYSLSAPTSVVITGCDSVGVLEQALDVAMRFRPLSSVERQQLLARTAGVGGEGKYELYKTSRAFDGTSHHPHWLETARE